MSDEPTTLYVCGRCFSTDVVPGPCPNCGVARAECDPGRPDDPGRKPPMADDGRLLSRAPLWWLLRSAPFLRYRLARKAGQKMPPQGSPRI